MVDEFKAAEGADGKQPGEQIESPETAEDLSEHHLPETNDTRFSPVAEEAALAREGHFEIKGVARAIDYFKQFGEAGERNLASLLESKNCFTFNKTQGERPAETISAEILSYVEPLVAQLEGELSGSNLEQQEITSGLNAIREMLYTVVIREIISGRKLRDIIGQIHYKPQIDVGGNGEGFGLKADPEKILGVTVLNEQDGRFDIYFYDRFFKGKDKAQAHVARHEFAHVLAEGTNIFDRQIYNKFLSYAGETNISEEQIAEISAQAPELGEILKIMRDPQKDIDVWNGYIKHRIEKLSELQGEELTSERQTVARELVAEMIAPYLSYGQSETTYLAGRLETANQSKLFNLLMSKAVKSDGSICQNSEEFVEYCRSKGLEIDIEKINPHELIDLLSKIPEFSSIFSLEKSFFVKLGEAFKDRGENITPIVEKYVYEEEELDEYDDFIDFSEFYDYEYGYLEGRGEQGASRGRADAPEKGFFSKLWNFITGKKDQHKAESGSTKAR